MPMDDASSFPEEQPMDGGAEPPMDDMNGGMPQDPNMGGPAPDAAGPDTGMDDMPDDMGAPEDGMAPEGEPESNGDDSTMSIINQLSDTDREAVRAYAESMLQRDETAIEGNGEEMGGGEPMQPMAESVIFTKKQIKKINESLIDVTKDDNKKELIGGKKPNKKISKKSPFNSPKFN